MKIRSITAFVDVTYPLDSSTVARVGETVRIARDALITGGLVVQTTRLAIQPFAAALGVHGPGRALDLARALQVTGSASGFDYVSLGPVRLEDPEEYVGVLPAVLGGVENAFASVEIAQSGLGIDLGRARRMAALVREVAALSADGFCNLRLAALANVQPWSPFFPAAYHGGGPPQLALAIESADLAVQAVSGASSLEDARQRLVRAIEEWAQRIETTVRAALSSPSSAFVGLDFSLAPYPSEAVSIGKALEQLGLGTAGDHGALMAVAFFADALQRARFRRIGFCEIFLPVLEDAILAQRAAAGSLGITELLVYSAVCGSGLDTIPLPGDISEDTLYGILLDVAALALRLDKPLTARLMPIPGRRARDPIRFEFEYFADSGVIAPKSTALSGLLAGAERLVIEPINARARPH